MARGEFLYHNCGEYGEDEYVVLRCVSHVCVVCYATHHRVMSQAKYNFKGFLKAQVIVHVEISLSV